MNDHKHGGIALIDGLGALFLVALLYIGTGLVGTEIDRAEADASKRLEQEGLRNQIRGIIPQMNITSLPLEADNFEIGGLRFDVEPQDGSRFFHLFFLSRDGGVKLFYITERD